MTDEEFMPADSRKDSSRN